MCIKNYFIFPVLSILTGVTQSSSIPSDPIFLILRKTITIIYRDEAIETDFWLYFELELSKIHKM